MNKTKGLLLAVATAAMAFTLSCSSDFLSNDNQSSSSGGDGGGESSSSDGGGGSSSSGGGGGSSSSGGGSSSSDGNSVSYHGKNYKTVTIGEQVWFAENLNHNVAGSKCYGEGGEVITGYDYYEYEEGYEEAIPITKTLSLSEVQANCEKYGRLYSWATAVAVCPEGWRLPSNDDWDELFKYVDDLNEGEGNDNPPYDSYTAGEHLKAADGWAGFDVDGNEFSGNGTDKYGFKALPGGKGNSDGSFYYGDVSDGNWWSSSEYVDDNSRAYYRTMYSSDNRAFWYGNDKPDLFSVRCVKN